MDVIWGTLPKKTFKRLCVERFKLRLQFSCTECGGTTTRKFPREPNKNQFVELKLRLPFFFYIKRYLSDKMFDIVLGTHLLNLSTWTPQNLLFWMAWDKALVFLDISRYLRDNFLHGLGALTPKQTSLKIAVWKLNSTIGLICWAGIMIKGARVWNCREWTELGSNT